MLCLPCFLHYSLASSFPLLYLSPLYLHMFGFLLVVPHSTCFPQSGAMCFPISAKGYGSASYRLCVPEKWALSVDGNSCFDVIFLNCSSCCNIELKCPPVRVSFSYWAGNTSSLSSNLFYYNQWLLIVPPIMKSWLNTLC